MKNFTLSLAALLCLFLSQANAQETFETRAHAIAEKIEKITIEEKQALKVEVELINEQLSKSEITKEFADGQKLAVAEKRARNIEQRTAAAQQELNDLVQDKVDGNIHDENVTKSGTTTINWSYKSKGSKENSSDTTKVEYKQLRTVTQFVFAAGLNNLVTDNAVAHSDYRYFGSHFYELGFTWNTRILKDHNLLHAKYGVSVMYNNLRPTDNRVFVENQNETILETSAINLKDSRFRNVSVVVPLHLEFDFSSNKNFESDNGFKTHQGFRVGLGGFAGFNVKSKQILVYEMDGNNHRNRERGDFNVNDFVYGVSAYVGYKSMSLYAKYDLNPLFENNQIDQNNVSLGLRFDLN